MVDVSPSIETTLGIPREEWLARVGVWEDAIHPDDRERVVEVSRHAAEFGEPFRIEYRAFHRDGRMLWIREDCVLIRDEVGEPVYWLGLMLDVSEFALAQRDLQEVQTKFGALVEQIPAIVYIDEADERMTTTYVSPQIEPLLGYTQHDYMTDPDLWTSMLHPDDRDGAVETYLRGRESGEPFVFEYRLVAKDGSVVWFRDSAIVLPRRRGARPVHPGRDVGHHRAQGRRGTDRLPRLPRQAHRPVEPGDVRRAARALDGPRPAQRPGRRRRVRGPRRLQAGERLARPRHRRPAHRAPGRPPPRSDARHRPRGQARRRRVPAAAGRPRPRPRRCPAAPTAPRSPRNPSRSACRRR